MDARLIDIHNSRITVSKMLEIYSIQSFESEWGIHQKSNLIESMMLQFPISDFVFYGYDFCINGFNRFQAIKEFVENEFSLVGLKYLEINEGLFFDDLAPWIQRRIMQYDCDIKKIQPYCTSDIKEDLIKRFK